MQGSSKKVVHIECFSGLTWDIGSGSENSIIKIKRRTEDNNQKFVVKHHWQNYYTIQSVLNEKYLTLEHDEKLAKLFARPYTGNTNQQFKFEKIQDDFVCIFVKSSGLGLDIDRCEFQHDREIHSWQFHGQKHAWFRLLDIN